MGGNALAAIQPKLHFLCRPSVLSAGEVSQGVAIQADLLVGGVIQLNKAMGNGGAVIGSAAVYLVNQQMVIFQLFRGQDSLCLRALQASRLYGTGNSHLDFLSHFRRCQLICIRNRAGDWLAVCVPLVGQAATVVCIGDGCRQHRALSGNSADGNAAG